LAELNFQKLAKLQRRRSKRKGNKKHLSTVVIKVETEEKESKKKTLER
jgi:hypothetical protein